VADGSGSQFNPLLPALPLFSFQFDWGQTRVAIARAEDLPLCKVMFCSVCADTGHHNHYPFLSCESVPLAAWFVSWRSLRWRLPYFWGSVNHFVAIRLSKAFFGNVYGGHVYLLCFGLWVVSPSGVVVLFLVVATLLHGGNPLGLVFLCFFYRP
jgi:hypothetical protein